MATQDPDLAEVIEAALSAHQERIYTMLPGRIEAFDQASSTADIQPLTANVYLGEDGERIAERMPVHTGVPVVFPSGGGYRLVFPLSAGDPVMLVYASRSISEVVTSSGEESVPADARRNHLSDPVAYPGMRLSPLKYAPEGVMSIGADDNDAVIDIDIGATEIRVGKGASEPTILGDTFEAALNTLIGAITATFGALNTYAQAIQGVADPGNAATPALHTATTTTWASAALAFEFAWSTYLTTIAKVK